MPRSAHAVIFPEIGRAELVDVQPPEPGDHDFVIRTTTTGVSVGTERWALLGKRDEMVFPMGTGYLGVGVIESVGKSVRGYAEGDRVFYSTAKIGEPYDSHGWGRAHVSHAVVPDTITPGMLPYHCPVPDSVPDASAVLAGLAAVSAKGADMVPITSGMTAVVLGLGIIGQSSWQAIRAKGARVVVADIETQRVDKALELGADLGVVLERDTPLAEQLGPHLPQAGLADVVVDTTSVQPVVQQLGSLAKWNGGHIILQGFYPGETSVDFNGWQIKRASVHCPCAMDLQAHQYCYRLIQSGALQLEPLVTHRATPEQAPEIYQMMLERPSDFVGIVFDWSQA